MAKTNTKAKSEWPTIRKRGQSWLVDCGKVFGARRRKTFSQLSEAEQYAADMRAERAQLRMVRSHERRNHAVTLANLTDTQRAEIIQAYEVLGVNRGLLDAARFYVQHSTPDVGELSLENVFDAYIKSKRNANRRPRTIRDAESKLRSFVYDNRERPVRSVTTKDIDSWIDERGYEGATRDAYRRAFLGLFNFAIKRRFVDQNPAAAIERTSGDQTMPRIHSVAEVKKLLHTAEGVHPAMIPYLAIGYFAGLRPENELARLDWRDVDLAERLIRVDPATAKKRRQRYVDISENLVLWLSPYMQAEGQIFYSRRYLRTIREKAGITWFKDVMRHSFASYHMAAHNNAAQTATQLGHAGAVDVLFNHYRNLVKPKAAKEYWKIKPAQEAKIIKLQKTA